jgi:hypothetical protein
MMNPKGERKSPNRLGLLYRPPPPPAVEGQCRIVQSRAVVWRDETFDPGVGIFCRMLGRLNVQKSAGDERHTHKHRRIHVASSGTIIATTMR